MLVFTCNFRLLSIKNYQLFISFIDYSIIATDSSKVLSQDVVVLLKHFCTKIQSLSR